MMCQNKTHHTEYYLVSVYNIKMLKLKKKILNKLSQDKLAHYMYKIHIIK